MAPREEPETVYPSPSGDLTAGELGERVARAVRARAAGRVEALGCED